MRRHDLIKGAGPVVVLLLVGCGGNAGGVGGSAGWSDWGPPWSASMMYRALEVGDLSALDESPDTGAEVDDPLQGWIEASGDSLAWGVGATDDVDAATIEVTFEASGGLKVSAAQGKSYDPAVVLLPKTFRSGSSEKTGELEVEVTRLTRVDTWYGSFSDVVHLEITGPGGDPLTGQLRVAQGVGPIQFVLDGQTGDLAWYE